MCNPLNKRQCQKRSQHEYKYYIKWKIIYTNRIKILDTHVTQFGFFFIGSGKRYTNNHGNCQHRLEIVNMRHLCKSCSFVWILTLDNIRNIKLI